MPFQQRKTWRGAHPMRHPYTRLIRLEIISIICALIIGTLALIKGFITLIFLCVYLISLSLIVDALIHIHTNQAPLAAKQVLRAILLFIFTTYFIFKL
ncbi:hypothetical protein J5S49_18650 [Virgibacillus halodenitrificans]|uniref:hypothetical protein n=1 Tax=Virgibacillus halodenitrificans TaxID=1482 RepID=UPI001F387D1C|nr:hypothetical protein [Virgibacillus halodenitrificans]MCG1030309.1 hypothetical protein [Virgibacillus halodenitrificans]